MACFVFIVTGRIRAGWRLIEYLHMHLFHIHYITTQVPMDQLLLLLLSPPTTTADPASLISIPPLMPFLCITYASLLLRDHIIILVGVQIARRRLTKAFSTRSTWIIEMIIIIVLGSIRPGDKNSILLVETVLLTGWPQHTTRQLQPLSQIEIVLSTTPTNSCSNTRLSYQTRISEYLHGEFHGPSGSRKYHLHPPVHKHSTSSSSEKLQGH